MTVDNQKYRQISFALGRRGAVTARGDTDMIFTTLPIRPEELTRTEPSRVTAVNSLDGAWVDSFGRGLVTITISGNTGWGTGSRAAGGSQFLNLRDNFVHNWHTLRRAEIAAGRDPNEIRLILIDALNNRYVADVVPMQFSLRRSKSQPLLFMYSLSMTVVAEKAENPFPDLEEDIKPPDKADASIESMKASVSLLDSLNGDLDGLVGTIEGFGEQALTFVRDTVGPAVKMAQDVIETVNKAKRVMDAVEQSIVNVAKELSDTATVLFSAVASVASLPNYAQSKLLQVKGAYSNLACCLSNGFENAMEKAKVNLEGFYGASNCSSTAGGSPVSLTMLTNSFVKTPAQSTASPISVSPMAQEGIHTIRTYDLATQIDTAHLAQLTTNVSVGVVIRA